MRLNREYKCTKEYFSVQLGKDIFFARPVELYASTCKLDSDQEDISIRAVDQKLSSS